MDFEGAASKSSVPAAGLFRIGSKSPRRTRRGQNKPSVEKRKVNYKQGINAHENRRHRSRNSLDLGRDRKKRAVKKLRCGLPNPAVFGVSPSSLSASDSAVEGELVTGRLNPAVFGSSMSSFTPSHAPARSSGGGKMYFGSAKDKLIAFYNEHNKSKLGSVDATLATYAGKEDTLFAKLANKYHVNPAVFGVDKSSTASFSNNTTGAFEVYATGNNSFGSWTPPKAQPGGFGSFKGGSSANHGSKGRSTINSLKTYTDDGFRASSGSDGEMVCD